MHLQTTSAVGGGAGSALAGTGAARADVEAAGDVAESALDTGFFGRGVSGQDIEQVQDAYASLDAEGKNEFVAGLSDTQLETWLLGVNTAGGGLPKDEKEDFLEDMATDLDASNLERVVGNMNYVGDGELLGTAIGEFASTETAVEFVDRLGPSFLTPAGSDANRVGAISTTEDVAARVIAELDTPAAIRSALETLEPEERRALATETYPTGGQSSEAFVGMIDAVSRSGSLELRTEFFEHLGSHSEAFRGDAGAAPDVPYLDEIYGGMKKLIEPDPVGTLDLLSVHNVGTPALVSYLELGIAREDNGHIGELGAVLRSGDIIPGDVGASDIERFSHDINGRADGGYANANRAGRFTGAVIAATENVNVDEKARADLAVSVVSGGLLTAAPLVPGSAVPIGIGTRIAPHVTDAIVSGAAGDRSSFAQAMIDAGMARDADGNLPPPSTGPRDAFVNGVSEVTDLP